MTQPKPQLPAGKMWRTQELLIAGVQPRAITRLVQSGDLVRPRRGCYVRGSWWTGLKPGTRSRYLIHARQQLNPAHGEGLREIAEEYNRRRADGLARG